MVFCANQTLPFRLSGGIQGVVLSRMHSKHRTAEVPYYERFFQARDYLAHSLPEHIPDFEGMGDALWHAGRELLWGGFGFRSSLEAYEYLAERLGVRILVLKLEDPDFYHLDTCLSIINMSTALIFPGAFDQAGLELISSIFPVVVEAPEDESRKLFACNGHSPDGRHVIIQRGCEVTVDRLRSVGLRPVEVDTDEFLKAGGSVFCMKQMFW
jgi:N-dimethylarginine dimethylaminohydrolase